jgi:hypothetical protein
MTQREDELERILRPWMRRHAPDAPNAFVLRMVQEIETMSEQAPTSGWLTRFAAWPATAWVAAVTAIVILAAAGGFLFANLTTAPTIGDGATPTPLPSPSESGDAIIVDGLLAAWNDGESQDATSRYVQFTPVVRFMIDSGDITKSLSTDARIQAAVVAWSADDSVMTRTGAIIRQGPFLAFPMTWTSSASSGNGVGLVRIDPGTGLILEHYLIGSTSPDLASAAPASAEILAMIDGELTAENAADGAAASAYYAADADARGLARGDLAGTVLIGRSAIADAISHNTGTATRTGDPIRQGPFVFYPGTTVSSKGEGDEGFNVVELDAHGLIRHAWTIGDRMPTVPSSSGG